MHYKKMLFTIISLILVLLGGCYVGLYFYQEKLLFYPQPLSLEANGTLQKKFPDIEQINLVTSDGVNLHGWFYKPQPVNEPSPLIIYFGGNAEEVSYWLNEQPHFENWAWLFINYRGYGLSQGEPSQKNLFADALFIYDNFAKRREVNRDKIVVMGRSLGTGVATYLAANRTTHGVILVSPYDSITEIAQNRFPFAPINLLIKHPFDSISYASSMKVPLFALIAEQDTIIPPSHSLNLVEAWPVQKRHLILKQSDHNTIVQDPQFWPSISKFLESLS